MEHLPVEVIGNILSLLGASPDDVLASTSCQKWRRARRYHVLLRCLPFNSDDWRLYHEFTTIELEDIIMTMPRTTQLQRLSIFMDDEDESSAAAIAWVIYTRDTLISTTPSIHILEICGGQKLEELLVSNDSIAGADLKYHALKSLSLTNVSISAVDLSLLLTTCPKLESLSLSAIKISVPDVKTTMELTSTSLKNISIESIRFDKFVLKADGIENLHLKSFAAEFCELVGKGSSLRVLQIEHSSITNLDIGGNTDNLEVFDVNNFTISSSRLYHMISRSSKLRKLGLWGVDFNDEDNPVDLESILVCFPLLSELSLSDYVLNGSSYLQNVTVLQLGWSDIRGLYSYTVDGMLERCPSLKTLVIHGAVPPGPHRYCKALADFTASIIRLMRKYVHVHVKFQFEETGDHLWHWD